MKIYDLILENFYRYCAISCKAHQGCFDLGDFKNVFWGCDGKKNPEHGWFDLGKCIPRCETDGYCQEGEYCGKW